MSDEKKKPEETGFFDSIVWGIKGSDGLFAPFTPSLHPLLSVRTDKFNYSPENLATRLNSKVVIPKNQSDELYKENDELTAKLDVTFISARPNIFPDAELDLQAVARKFNEILTKELFGFVGDNESSIKSFHMKNASAMGLSYYGMFKSIYVRYEPDYVVILNTDKMFELFRQNLKRTVWVRIKKGNWLLIDTNNLMPYVEIQVTQHDLNGQMYLINRSENRRRLWNKGY